VEVKKSVCFPGKDWKSVVKMGYETNRVQVVLGKPVEMKPSGLCLLRFSIHRRIGDMHRISNRLNGSIVEG
jgi:hypothetical protein